MQNKVVIITGASSGIGKALAIACAQQQAIVVLAARRINLLNELVDKLNIGNRALAIETDVTQPEACKKLIEITLQTYGKIDCLINNAGVSMRANFLQTNFTVLKQLMDVNFWGAVYCTQYALPHIIKQQGTIVAVASIAAYIGLPGRTGYSASKYALRGFFDALRVENLRQPITILLTAPGFTATEIRQTALTENGTVQSESPRDESKMMSAETCAQKIVQAIIHKKSRQILTFQEGKLTVFLSKWFPNLLDKLIYKHIKKEPGAPF